MKKCQVATVVGKDRLVFYFVYMEYTVRICQREVIQFAKAILVIQCTIGFAEARHVVSKVAFVFKWYPDDAIRWFFVLLCQSFVLVQFHYIEIGYLELLGQFSNFIESHWFSIHIHVSVRVELT